MESFSMFYGGGFQLTPAIALLLVWSLFWKGLGLWHSAKRGQGWWFIAILIINTAGILEIIYLFLILKLKISNLFPKKGTETL